MAPCLVEQIIGKIFSYHGGIDIIQRSVSQFSGSLADQTGMIGRIQYGRVTVLISDRSRSSHGSGRMFGYGGHSVRDQLQSGIIVGTDSAHDLSALLDDIFCSSAVDLAAADYRIVAGMDAAAYDGLEGHDHLAGHDDGVHGILRLCAVTAFSFYIYPEGSGACHDGAVFTADLAGLQFRSHMISVIGIHVIQKPGLDHGRGSAGEFLL